MNTRNDIPEAILRGDEILGTTIEWFSRTNGDLAHEDAAPREFMPFSVIHVAPESGLPPYLFCGSTSIVADFYGQGFAKNPERRRHTVADERLEESASRAYLDVARTGMAMAQEVDTSVTVRGNRWSLLYRRLILPVRVLGTTSVLVLAREVRPPRIADPRTPCAI